MPLIRDLRLLLGLSPRRWQALGCAMVELAAARWRLTADHSRHLAVSGPQSIGATARLTPAQSRLVDAVHYAVPRVAARLPWRADCLVQALAAKRWLGRHDIDSRLVIGARLDGAAPLDAHAWLEADDRVVTGGDPAGFSPLARSPGA